MNATADSIKTLASRFAGLPSDVRVEIARKLLTRENEEQDRRRFERQIHNLNISGRERASFIEQFWDEVAKSCEDDF